MKFSSVLLAGSLVANVALLAAFVLVPADSPPASLGPAVTGLGTASSRTPVLGATTPSTPDSAKPWAKLGTGDLATTVARLRSAGFPPSVLRAVINQRFELRRQALTYDEISGPYWKDRPRTTADAKTTAALAQLERERTEVTKQLLGADEAAGSDAVRVFNAQLYGNLSHEKISALIATQQDYFNRIAQLRDASGGTLTPADPNAPLLQKEMQDALAKLLTPEELLEYNLRASSTSARLRQSLTGLNVTEAEFRALFPLYQAIDDQFPLAWNSIDGTPDQMAARRAAEQQNQEQIKALLGPERYADYQQASRPEYQQLNALVARLDLPLSAAVQVASVQQDIQQRIVAVRADRKLSADARTAQLNTLGQEAASKITATLGTRGLEGYKQNGGQWLTSSNRAQSPTRNRREAFFHRPLFSGHRRTPRSVHPAACGDRRVVSRGVAR